MSFDNIIIIVAVITIDIMDSHAVVQAVERGDITYLQTRQFDPNLRDDYGNALIHVAAEGGDRHMVEYLISQPGVNLTLLDEVGDTVLLVATKYGVKHNNFDILWLLLTHQLSQLQVVGTLSHLNTSHCDVVYTLASCSNNCSTVVKYPYNSIIKRLYQKFAAHLDVRYNLIDTIKWVYDNYEIIDFLLYKISPSEFHDGRVLRELCQIKFEREVNGGYKFVTEVIEGYDLDHILKIFDYVFSQTPNIETSDDQWLTAAEYCIKVGNVTLLKKLLLTGKVTTSRSFMLGIAGSNSVEFVIRQYFRNPEHTTHRWSKELDRTRGAAADLYCLYLQHCCQLVIDNYEDFNDVDGHKCYGTDSSSELDDSEDNNSELESKEGANYSDDSSDDESTFGVDENENIFGRDFNPDEDFGANDSDDDANNSKKYECTNIGNVVRFFGILNKLNDDCVQIVCLRCCGNITSNTIPNLYIKVAWSDTMRRQRL